MSIHHEQVTLYRDGSQYVLNVEVNMQRIAEELLERAARNKSHRSKACSGAVIVGMMSKVPVK
jgi:hypothetical protein